jgi:hypothetical protein
MKRIGTFLALTVVALLLLGQGAPNNGSYMTPNGGPSSGGGGITQHGAVTPGDCASWFASGSIQDAGAPCGGGGNTITLTAGTNIAAGTSVSINSSGQAVQTWGPAPNINGVVTTIAPNAYANVPAWADAAVLSSNEIVAWTTDGGANSAIVPLSRSGTTLTLGNVLTTNIVIAGVAGFSANSFVLISEASATVYAGTISGGAITLGTSTDPGALARQILPLTSTLGVALLNNGTVAAFTLSGTTIAFGAPATITGASQMLGVALTTSSIVIFFDDSGNSNTLTAVVVTISGTTATVHTPVALSGVTPSNPFSPIGIAFSQPVALTPTSVVLGYSVGNAVANTGLSGYAAALSISGTTITWGTPALVSSNVQVPYAFSTLPSYSIYQLLWPAVSIGTTQVAFGFGGVLPQLCTVSGTTITVPASIGLNAAVSFPLNGVFGQFNETTSYQPSSIAINAMAAVGSNLMIVDGISDLYETNGAGVVSPPIQHLNTWNYGINPLDSSDVLAWFFDSNLNFLMRVVSYEPINNGPVGFAGTACTNGNPCTVTTGGIAAGFSGLTPGVTYYSNGDGTITLGNTGGLGTLAGVALTNSTLLIQRGRTTTNYLLKRDLDPASNDNSPAFMDQAA